MTAQAADAAILERNLRALARTSPDAARLIEMAQARTDIEFHEADDGAISASITIDGARRALASRRRPLDEAERLADRIDLHEAGGVVVLGFGAGHHVASLARRMRRAGVIIVHEPDISLLRAIFERIDHSQWISRATLIMLTRAGDTGEIAAAVRGVEGILALGVKILEHPPSAARLGDGAGRFVESLMRMVRSMRTTIVTTLVQVETTMRNELSNLRHYATRPGVGELAGIGAGRPAIVVAAGPSLARTIHLLEDPSLRDRAVIIAVQTVLKPLLARGIRPHFVTALDYHAISRRFYEGLTPEDVQDVTLVAEAKANPAILNAYPGDIRCPHDRLLESVLGPYARGDRGMLEAGATVAHLGCYLARHLGCDPLILTGQDLGFTDGQYYASGAAIHQVWSGELNEFNTLEMMEWQRIARGRKNLRRVADIQDRPIYTDEQMHTYLVQFERDFAADEVRGLRTIDATEGGVRKKHTEVMTLGDALDGYAAQDMGDLLVPAPAPIDADALVQRARERLIAIRRDVKRVRAGSLRAATLLERMQEHISDAARTNALIDEVRRIDARVKQLTPAYPMVQHINQTGTLNRYRADRDIELEEGLTARERQKRQIERDITNVTWLAQAAETLEGMLKDAESALTGGAPVEARRKPRRSTDVRVEQAANTRISALICVDPDTDALGRPRSLDDSIIHGRIALQCVLHRLARCTGIGEVVLLTDQPERVRAIVGTESPITVHIEACEHAPMRARADAIRGARAWADACWRGGLGSMTCYDELLAPTPMLGAMQARAIDAAILVGADWALVDPAIVDAIIARHLERPDTHRLVFSQAPPGLGACLIDQTLMGELSERAGEAGVFASVGGLVGYLPIMPQADPIARPPCVDIPAFVRDVHMRCVADGAMRPRLARIADAAGGDSSAIVRALADDLVEYPDSMPDHVVLECTSRRACGDSGDVLNLETARHILGELRNTHTPITLAGRGDPLTHEHFDEILAMALEAGPVHVRTDLRADSDALGQLIDSGVSVISVDLPAHTRETYEALTGVDAFDRVRTNIEYLLERRRTPHGPDGLPTPWIVPRIARCDAAIEDVEMFFDTWLMRTGAAVIDPLPRAREGERIGPLARPPSFARRVARTTMMILADGSIAQGDNPRECAPAAHIRDGSLADLWNTLAPTHRARFAPEGAFCTPAPCS